jgi:peptide/nickel transport system substrate-binding protein
MVGAAALGAMSVPMIGRAQTAARTLKFIPVINLAHLDPVFATAQVTRTHALMVFDTLFGMNSKMEASPQMLEGYTIDRDGLQWNLKLRDGLAWHDGEKVLARDCVASIKRWAKRDAAGISLMNATAELKAVDDKTIRFDLKRPFPYLAMVLGKTAAPACFMMPERLALTDASQAITEIIGSGPFKYKADERVPGARNVYEKNQKYVPRPNGVSDMTAGPKIVHFDRVIWTTMPDAATGTMAVQSGEQDWQEAMPHDLLPIVENNPAFRTAVLDPLGFTCAMRINHLQAPFNNPAVRRALMGAIDQAAFMAGVAGNNPKYTNTPIGFFPPQSPLASKAGMEAVAARPNYDKVREELKKAGYAGEKVVLLVPADSLAQKPLGDVAADIMKKAGMNVEYTALDFGTVLKRRTSKASVAEGGWSAFVGNWQGLNWADPIGNSILRGDESFSGWYKSAPMETLIQDWTDAASLDKQKEISQSIQKLAFEEVPYYPLGQYLQPTLYKKDLVGMLSGAPLFWNIKRA